MWRNPKAMSRVKVAKWQQKEIEMRGVLLWLVGIPIPIIILLYLFHVV
jgi:hypothetical protein